MSGHTKDAGAMGTPELPAWRLLAEGIASSVDGDVVTLGEGAVCSLPDGEGDWPSVLEDALDHVQAHGVLVVTFGRSWGGALLTLASQGRWKRRPTPPLRQVRRVLIDRGMRVEGTYSVWPSAGMPRIILPRSQLRMTRWLQGSGLMHGMGRSIPLQLFGRSVLFTLLALRLPPAVALVARKAVRAP